MIIRNTTFQNDLQLENDRFHTISVASPRLFTRIIQSFISLENGEEPVEHFMLIDNGIQTKASSYLIVVSDIFTIDLNSRRFTSMLYAAIEKALVSDVERYHQWKLNTIEASEILRETADQFIPDIASCVDISVSDYAKISGLKFDIPRCAEVKEKLYTVMDVIAEFCPGKILIVCNLLQYLTQPDWKELMKYACYLKIKLIDIERKMNNTVESQEIRWIIDEDFDDRIIRG